MGILKNLYQAIGELAQALISYMHIFVDILKVYHRDVQLIVGPGHAGNALIANCQIELEKKL